MFTVEKVVDGEASPPPDAQFVVTAVCTGEGAGNFEITFDASGAPVGSNEVGPGFTGSCTFTETQTADANNVAYACEISDPPNAFAECTGGGADPVTINFEGASDLTGTVTVTNTYDLPPPPPVVLQPVFTG